MGSLGSEHWGDAAPASRLSAVLAASNRAIVYERDSRRLLDEVCRVAVEVGGMRMAYIVLVGSGSDDLTLAARRGVSVEALAAMGEAVTADPLRGRGPVQRAITERRSTVSQDVATDPNAEPWRGMALDAGLLSTAAIPLVVEEELIGVLSVAASEKGRFDATTVAALEELAADLAFALRAIRAMDMAVSARKAAEAAADYLRAVTSAMAEGLYALDRRGTVTYVNESAADMLGWAVEALLGRNAHDTFHPRASDGTPVPVKTCPAASCAAEVVDRGGLREAFVRRNGSSLDVVASVAAFTTEDGERGTVVVFNDAEEVLAEELRRERELAELSWVGRLRDALAEDRLLLYAQPIANAETGATLGHELLLRLRTPDGTIVRPGEFLPAAERYGLMTEIDAWVLRQAVALAATGVPVAFNLSGASLADPRVVDELRQAVQAAVEPSSLVVEITEAALLGSRSASRQALERIAAIGCRVAIDNFGTGYGGLTNAKQFPIDMLKIDAEFVRDAATSEESRSVVRAVVALARGLGLTTVAEGVEDEEALAAIRGCGVDLAQGYLVGRPAPLDTLTAPSP